MSRFAVLLGDTIMDSVIPVTQQLMDTYETIRRFGDRGRRSPGQQGKPLWNRWRKLTERHHPGIEHAGGKTCY